MEDLLMMTTTTTTTTTQSGRDKSAHGGRKYL